MKKTILNHDSIAEAYGIKINYDGDAYELCAWDGQQINAEWLSNDVIIHDISHWIVASEKRKQVPDFGLGPSPDSSYAAYRKAFKRFGKQRSKLELTNDNAQHEEVLACALEFCFESLIGIYSMIDILHERIFIKSIKEPLKWNGEGLLDVIPELQKLNKINRLWVPYGIEKLVKPVHRDNLANFRKFVRSIGSK